MTIQFECPLCDAEMQQVQGLFAEPTEDLAYEEAVHECDKCHAQLTVCVSLDISIEPLI